MSYCGFRLLTAHTVLQSKVEEKLRHAYVL